MSYCINCGAKLPDRVRFCTGCGAPVPFAETTEVSSPQQDIEVEQRQTIPAETTIVQQPVQPQPAPVQQPSPIYTAPVQGQQPSVPIFTPAAVTVHGVEIPPPVGSRYAPVSTGGFICIFLMMLLPIVNLILLIVWACGGCRKVNQSQSGKGDVSANANRYCAERAYRAYWRTVP